MRIIRVLAAANCRSRQEMTFDVSLALTITLFACLGWASGCGGSPRATTRATPLSEEEKHRLYSAALASDESPLDTDIFKRVCRRIEIVDANGRPNDQYMAFVSRHVNWSMTPAAEDFRKRIGNKQQAIDYINQHLQSP